MKNIIFLILTFFTLFCFSQESSNKEEEDSISYYLNQSIYLINKGQTSEAISLTNKAFDLAKKIKNDKLITSSYSYFATIYKKTGDYEKAEAYYKKIIDQNKKINNYRALSSNYNSYANLLVKMNQEEEALNKFYEAIKYAKLDKSQFYESTANVNISDYYFSKKNYQLARKHSYKSYELAIGLKIKNAEKFINQLKGFSSELIGMSELYLDNFDKGDLYLKKALPFFEKDSINEHISRIHFSYFEYYNKKRNYKKAIEHHQKYTTHLKLNQEFLLKEKTDQINQLSNFEDNILKLELAEKEIKLQKEIKKRLTYFLIFAVIATIFLIFISIILKRKNKFLKILKEEAIKSSTKKSQFIDMITHELKTPLYTILGSSNILSDEFDDSKKNKNKHLNSLNSAANYLLNLVNNILNLSKFESNKLEIEASDFNFPQMIHRIIDVYELKFIENKNKLHLSIDEKIPKKLVGDSPKISQILINLISNANKFTKEGDIWISAELVESTDGFSLINFTIRDNGIGISNIKQNTIFQEFSDTSQSIDKEYQGTGLGLSIVKRLVTLFDSTIELESKENEGTTFSFKLKIKEGINDTNEENTVDFSFLNEKNILVVEDNKINQMITVKTLKKIGVICDTADNGLIAVTKFEDETSNYDAILMDLHMPIMNGFDATLKIRESDSTIPIIALTAVNIDKAPDNLKKLGLNYSMNKPFKVDILFSTLIKYIKESKDATN